MFERKRARCSSSATAWRNVRTLALLAVYGNAFARTTPTELTVSLQCGEVTNQKRSAGWEERPGHAPNADELDDDTARLVLLAERGGMRPCVLALERE